MDPNEIGGLFEGDLANVGTLNSTLKLERDIYFWESTLLHCRYQSLP